MESQVAATLPTLHHIVIWWVVVVFVIWWEGWGVSRTRCNLGQGQADVYRWVNSPSHQTLQPISTSSRTEVIRTHVPSRRGGARRWGSSEGGLPKLPITSVAAVLGVGTIVLEVLAHAPVVGLVLPRVLTYAAWLAVAGIVLDKREPQKTL